MARLGEMPRYRQRLSSPRTGGLHWPRWQDDQRFDIGRHVTEAGLPQPGGERELLDWAGDYFSQRLERSRPLWEIVLLTLADGRWAMVTKTHHCMVDGVGSVDVARALLDTRPDPPPAADPAERGPMPGDPTLDESGEWSPPLPGVLGQVASGAWTPRARRSTPLAPRSGVRSGRWRRRYVTLKRPPKRFPARGRWWSS